MAADKHVAAVTAASGIPVSCRIAGLTKTMYAIVMNVVQPARISVRQLAPRPPPAPLRATTVSTYRVEFLPLRQEYFRPCAFRSMFMGPRLHSENDSNRSEEHTSELQSLRHLVC